MLLSYEIYIFSTAKYLATMTHKTSNSYEAGIEGLLGHHSLKFLIFPA